MVTFVCENCNQHKPIKITSLSSKGFMLRCGHCDKEYWFTHSQGAITTHEAEPETCPSCKGKGHEPQDEFGQYCDCEECKGTGQPLR